MSRAKKVFLWIAGILLILIGIVALPLPIAPGGIFIFWGVCLLGGQGPLLALIIWFFTLIGLGGFGAALVRWLKKMTPRGINTNSKEDPPSQS